MLMFTAVQCAFTDVFVCPMLNVCRRIAIYLHCTFIVSGQCVFSTWIIIKLAYADVVKQTTAVLVGGQMEGMG